MSLSGYDGLVWVVACLVLLLIVQRKLHWELQAVFLLLTRRPSLALGLFSFLFFPGVLLHEASHFLMAILLRVRTGRFSLWPRLLPDGRLRLGYVETAKVDPLRDSLIGTAPLLSGGAVVAWLAVSPLNLLPLQQSAFAGQWDLFWQELLALPTQPDFWLWFYLAFAVSTTMLPSASDRQSWLPVVLAVIFLVVLAVLAGAGPWMLQNLAPYLNTVFRALGAIFGLSVILHLILLIPTFIVRKLLNGLTGLQVAD